MKLEETAVLRFDSRTGDMFGGAVDDGGDGYLMYKHWTPYYDINRDYIGCLLDKGDYRKVNGVCVETYWEL